MSMYQGLWSRGDNTFYSMKAKNRYDKEQMNILKLYCHDAAVAFVKDDGLCLLKYTDLPNGMDTFLKHILTASGYWMYLKQCYIPLGETLDLYRLKYKFIVSGSKTEVTLRKLPKDIEVCNDYEYDDDQVCEVNCTDIIEQTEPSYKEKTGITKPKKKDPIQEKLIAHLRKSLATPVKSDKAMKMMRNMGWDGGSLGTRGDGILEPIMPALDINLGAGLGHTEETPQQTSPKQNKYTLLIDILENLLEFLRSKESSVEILCPSDITDTERCFMKNLIHMMRLRKRVEVKDPVRAELLRLINEEMVRLKCLQVTYSIVDEAFIIFTKIPMPKRDTTAKKVKAKTKSCPGTPKKRQITPKERSETRNSCQDIPNSALDINTRTDSANSSQDTSKTHLNISNSCQDIPSLIMDTPVSDHIIQKSCHDIPNICTDTLNIRSDNPKICPDTPNRYLHTPNSRQDILNIHPDTSNSYEDILNIHPDTPNSCENILNIHPDTPNSNQDILNTHPDTPNSNQDILNIHTDPRNRSQDIPNKNLDTPISGQNSPTSSSKVQNRCQQTPKNSQDSKGVQHESIIMVKESIISYINSRYVYPFCPIGVASKCLTSLVFRCSVLVYILDFVKSGKNQTEIRYGNVLCSSARGFVKDIVVSVNKGHNKNGSKTVVEKYLLKEIFKVGKRYFMAAEFGFLNTSIILEKIWCSKKSKSNLAKNTNDSTNINGTNDNIKEIFAILDKAFPPITLHDTGDCLTDEILHDDGDYVNDLYKGKNITIQIKNDVTKRSHDINQHDIDLNRVTDIPTDDSEIVRIGDNNIAKSNDVFKVNSDKHNQSDEENNKASGSSDVIVLSDDDGDEAIPCIECSDEWTSYDSDIDEPSNNKVKSLKNFKSMLKRNKKKNVLRNIDGKCTNISNKRYNIEVVLQEGIKSIKLKDSIEDFHPKRMRSDSETSDLKISKKYKTTDVTSVSLTPKNSDKVNIGFVKHVQTSISNRIDNSNDDLPLLKCHGFKNSELIYSCHNESSLRWLQAVCIDNGIKLMIKNDIKVEDINMSLKIRSFIDKDYKTILQRLELYNKGLFTSQWVWLKEEKFYDFIVITFKIDENAYNYIKDANFRLFAGVDEVRFSVVWY